MSEITNQGMEILKKADAVISVLEDSSWLSVDEIAKAVGEPVSSTYRLLSNLRIMGWVDEGPQRGLYRLGLEFLRIGTHVEELRNLQGEALPWLQQLNQSTHLTTFLCVRRSDEAVCVGRFEGRNVRSLVLTLGGSLPLDCGAAANALLSHLPKVEQEGVLERLGYRSNTPEYEHKIAELSSYSEQGLAISDEHVTAGIGAIGAPIFNFRCETVASIAVSGLRSAVIQDPNVRNELKFTALEISRALGCDDIRTYGTGLV